MPEKKVRFAYAAAKVARYFVKTSALLCTNQRATFLKLARWFIPFPAKSNHENRVFQP